MRFPTWHELIENYCSVDSAGNQFYEEFAVRRYNYAASSDPKSCRLLFLKETELNPSNRTLRRKGRFIWCRNLRYEKTTQDGLRSVSFTVDSGSKRFLVNEKNILCLPNQVCVSNNRYFRSRLKTFHSFSSVFSYKPAMKMMAKNAQLEINKFKEQLAEDNPYKPGTLIVPRLGYFYPDESLLKEKSKKLHKEHPCGIILGPSLLENNYVTKEFYRVRFGNITYEKIHPVQMEIVT